MTDLENNNILINQTLHGYQNGHSLIASSIEINNDVKRNMLGMSDMSGQSMHPKFQNYLTGYPLKEMALFAFAKTWYAPEMERPGCVYTHTLLINFVDLIKINNLKDLTDLFVKPITGNFNAYKTSITFNFKLNTTSFIDPAYPKEDVVKIIDTLYSQNELSALITSPDSNFYESLCLSIWSQQWPRLRRNFSFCTGSISNRSLNGKNLDLQVIPNSSDINTINSGLLAKTDKQINNLLWAEKIYDDLKVPGSLRDFFIDYGADTPTDRRILKLLTEVYLILDSRENKFSEFVTKIGKEFPDKSSAINLKNKLLSDKIIESSYFPDIKMQDVLKELATTKVYDSFDFEKLLIFQKLNDLYISSPNTVLQLLTTLLQENINPIGVNILRKISELVTEESEDIYKEEHRNLLLIFAKLNPKLAYNYKFWQVDKEYQRENFYTIYQNNIEGLDWRILIDAILQSGAKIPGDIFNAGNKDLSKYVLDWFNKETKRENEQDWLNPKYFNQSLLLEWLSKQTEIKNIKLLELLIYCLDPNSKEVTKLGSKIWVNVCSEKILFYKDRQSHIRLNSFAFAVSFHSCDKYSQRLLELTFEQVYMAALSGRIDYDSWKIIEVHTQPLQFWNDWDKCKKIAIAVVKKYQGCKWEVKTINNLFSEKFVYESFVRNLR